VVNRLQIDASYGNRFGRTGHHWFTVGLKAASVPFLP
jgi:hypothetical protein